MSKYDIQSYFICTSPRSGSTLLCKLLSATKIAGNPGSHFHEPSIGAWLGYYGLERRSFASEKVALAAIFASAIEAGKGDTGIFGLRLQRGSFRFFMDRLKLLKPNEATDRERVNAIFGPTLFIYLRRDNYLDQAISRLRAEQTGLWHRKADGSDLERKEPTRDTGYDRGAIQEYLQQAEEQNEQWARWFDEQSITPLEISYDELSREPQAILSRVLTNLGVDASVAKTVPIQTTKLADETNLAWRARFKADIRATQR